MIEKNHRESNECCHAQLSARWPGNPEIRWMEKKNGR